jgi:hypothetical protein
MSNTYQQGETVQGGPWDGFKVISVYTRAQAIEDGVLVDVSETAREAGIRFPVAVTREVWSDYITPDPRSVPYGQSESGRLWDLCWMLRVYAKRAGATNVIEFPVVFIMKAKQRRTIWLRAEVGPGDNMEPVITVGSILS